MAIRRILLTGGGSGGHVYPLIAVAEALRSLDLPGEQVDLMYMGPHDAYSKLFENLAVTMHTLPGAKLRRYFSVQNFLDIPLFFLAVIKALFLMFWIMPDAVFSKGGPGALPVVFAAWFYRVPVLVHESDMTPGLTNKVSAWFARRVAVSFEAAQQFFPARKVAWTGHPERRSIREAGLTREAAKARLGFMTDEPLALIIGGSQGSQRLNEAALGALPQIAPVTAVYHQAGTNNADDALKLAEAGMLGIDGVAAARHPWKVVPYIMDIGVALTAADAVISRAGSGSIFEIASFGRAAILVPLPESANDHQRLNAVAFMQGGGGTVVEEANLVPGILARTLAAILGNPEQRNAMEVASRSFSREGAADVIAAELLRL